MNKGLNITLGEVITDFLYLWEMPTVELSVRLGLPLDETKGLINNTLNMTEETAERFESISSVSKDFWMSLPVETPKNKHVLYMNQA